MSLVNEKTAVNHKLNFTELTLRFGWPLRQERSAFKVHFFTEAPKGHPLMKNGSSFLEVKNLPFRKWEFVLRKCEFVLREWEFVFRKRKFAFSKILFFSKMGVCFRKMGVCFAKMGVCFSNIRVCFSKMGVCFAKIRVCFSKIGVCFLENGRGFLMMKMIDRPSTTPIGQDRASQWRNVLFDLYLFEARPRYFVCLTAFQCKMGLTSLHEFDSTVRDIFTIAVLCSVTRPGLFFFLSLP